MESRGEKVRNEFLALYDDYVKEVVAGLKAEWKLDQLPIDVVPNFEQMLREKLQTEFNATWDNMEMTGAVDELRTRIEDAKKKGLTHRDNRPWPKTPHEETRLSRIGMLRTKIEIAENGIHMEQKSLAHMYKKCERRRNVLEDTMKKRIECMEYMANNCIPADDMFQLGVKLNNKLYDEEEEELSAPGRYN